MKKNIQKTLKYFAVIFLIVINVFTNTLVAIAIKIPSANEVASDIEKRYHFNQGSIQNIGEGMNVADNKKTLPQVLLTFSPTDPKPGEKLTVKANQMFFKNTLESLYYTWYLKHNSGGKNNGNKDWDDDKKIDTKDYRIEAMRILAQGGWQPNYFDYEVDDGKIDDYYGNDKIGDNDDDDGYKAAWGGDLEDGGRKDTKSPFYEVSGNEAYCYLYDAPSGKTYEIRDKEEISSETVNACGSGSTLKCVTETGVFCGNNLSTFSVCMDVGAVAPTCDFGTAACSSGTPMCVPNSVDLTDNCSVIKEDRPCSDYYGATIPGVCANNNGTKVTPSNFCRHLFPEVTKTGDGQFNKKEEKFWLTDPKDPDTADNGNKDEANVVGLGQTEFSWIYSEGDEVGVVIEGNSASPTKHDDGSYMIMWATPVKHCDLKDVEKGEYAENIKGYNVNIPYVDIGPSKWDDFWDRCLKDNLVDPRKGGQAGKLNVTLSKTPENPVNIEPITSSTSDEKINKGDIVTVQSTLENALSKDGSEIKYNWKVEISEDGSGSPTGAWKNICDYNDCMFDKESISNLTGINVSALSFKLNLLKDNIKKKLNSYGEDVLDDGMFFLRVSLHVRENFNSESTREGRGSIIIKVNTSDNKIEAFIPEIDETAEGKKILKSKGGTPICEDAEDASGTLKDIQTEFCYVTENQIVGVKFDEDEKENFEDFAWKLDGEDLICNTNVSADCSDSETKNVSFFPVKKGAGEIYTVSLSATKLSKNGIKGKTVRLTRKFIVVEPYVKIVPEPDDNSIIMKKYLGTYTSLDENVCVENPGSYFNPCYDYSDRNFEVSVGAVEKNEIKLKAEYHPWWIGSVINNNDVVEWTVNRNKVQGEKDDPNTINLKEYLEGSEEGDVFEISIDALYRQNNDTRKALRDIWKINQFETTEDYLSHTVRLKMTEGTEGESAMNSTAYRKFFATVFTNTPGNIAFLVRIMLTAIMLIFLGGLAHPSASRKVF